MRKLAGLMALALVAVALVPNGVIAGKKGKKKATYQKVEGSVAMMLPFYNDLDACYTGAHRRIAVLSQEQVNGDVGYHFDVDPGTANRNFKLEVTGGMGEVDLDITFYSELGTTEQATDTGYAPYNVSFEERTPGGEAGIVPPDMTKAIVCMWNGQNATFTYEAGKGVK